MRRYVMTPEQREAKAERMRVFNTTRRWAGHVYKPKKKYGTDTKGLELTQAEKSARLEARVNKIESGCWEWTLAINTHGYGSFWLAGRVLLAHRAAYDIYIGPIPHGMFVCHTCDNPKCCNPEHLFLGSVLANNRDTAQKNRCRFSAGHYLFCKHGHEYTPENTIMQLKTRGTWQRRCRACQVEYQKIRTERQREKRRRLQHNEQP